MPYVDALCTLLERLIRDRLADPQHAEAHAWEVVPQLRAVLAQADHHDLTEPHDDDHDLVNSDAALAVIHAARTAQQQLAAIERAAAAIARDNGVTVRRLADAAGITERAAAERYRRTSLSAEDVGSR
ncbi:hypothetical protein [Actinokineospora sp. HUAS TT18]|uniref:hypothetical protein n=1 Tax=Actinokineospora sp. HUAS TT18 TaxID=3447451 RepID=UPI003F51B65A